MKKIYPLMAIPFILAANGYAQKANTDLSNLSSHTAINHSLTPVTTSTKNLGSWTQKWKNLFLSQSLRSDSVLASGAIAIGISNPDVEFYSLSGISGQMGHPYETGVFEKSGDNKVGIYSSVTDPSLGGSAIVLGYSNYKINNFYPGYEIQNGIFADDPNASYLRFNALVRDDAGTVVTGTYGNVMVMDNTGHVGINLGNVEPVPHPTANLHIKGTVRFENLPTGGGTALVMDDDGNVFKGSLALGRAANTDDSLANDVKFLKNEVADLKSQVDQLLALMTQKSDAIVLKNSTKIFTVYPNPSNDVINISSLSGNITGDKKVILQDIAGKNIHSFSMNNNTLSIPVKNILPGIYTVNIYGNNTLLQSEKVVVK